MPKLGLSTETGMDLLCILGILISFCCVVFYTARDMVSFTLLWMMYLSLYQVHTMLLNHDNIEKIVEGCTLFLKKLLFNFHSQCKVSIEKKINLKIFLKNINAVMGGGVML